MLDHIEVEISKVLDNLVYSIQRGGGTSNREWTKRVKECLCTLGKQNGYRIAASHCAGADTAEWIYDMVWASVQDDPWQFWEMPLAMQCEWSTHSDDIVWHFEKLLVAKAHHKLMVFQQAVESDVRDVMEQLKTMVKAFKTSFQGERYLLAGYAFDERKFFYEAI
jgi:hypothetical protein